jgi:hypothetical protein
MQKKPHLFQLPQTRLCAGADLIERATGNGFAPPSDDSSARKKGPPVFGGPSLGRNAPRSKTSSLVIALSI